jgi:phage gp46-like protein
MADIKLDFDPKTMQLDISFDDEPDDVDIDTTLKTAVLVSLFSDKRASIDDVLPQEGASRRGWWGDNFTDIPHDQIGSKLWLFERESITQDVVNGVKEAAEESLQWLIDDNIASKIDVETEVMALGSTNDTIALGIIIHKPDGTKEIINFENVWEGLA